MTPPLLHRVGHCLQETLEWSKLSRTQQRMEAYIPSTRKAFRKTQGMLKDWIATRKQVRYGA
jgi:hypothetical protein